MNPYRRFVAWLAREEIAAARAQGEAVAAVEALEAYRLGKAHGEGEGRAQVVRSLNDLIDARREIVPQMTEEDILRVTKGVLH